jgi:hypothetical protein
MCISTPMQHDEINRKFDADIKALSVQITELEKHLDTWKRFIGSELRRDLPEPTKDKLKALYVDAQAHAHKVHTYLSAKKEQLKNMQQMNIKAR